MIDRIDKAGKGILLIVDAENRLLGTVTDGDVRRWILARKSLDAAVGDLLEHKKVSPYPRPVTAPVGTPQDVLLRMMHDQAIHQIPLVDEDGKVVDLVTLDELLPDQALPMQAVIMAGGFGTRLRPLTEDIPKPMLPVGGRPLMELDRQRSSSRPGIRRVNVTHALHAGEDHRALRRRPQVRRRSELRQRGPAARHGRAPGPDAAAEGDACW